MSNYVAIQNTAMPVVEYQGKRVVTFAMIDKAHGRPKGTAGRYFRRHRERFIEGSHFFELSSGLIVRNIPTDLFPKKSPKGCSSPRWDTCCWLSHFRMI
ncbi:ORF6N domain-containing protein [Sodalis glossinidius]|uniref:ORF6N domain-containing protein n=1 Tax=Sodalis glossinidius TaxID=63612 RepID=UPI000A067920